MPTDTWNRLSIARREAVLISAQDEFSEHGFSRGSLSVIARNADVAKGSLFQYFDDARGRKQAAASYELGTRAATVLPTVTRTPVSLTR